MTTPLGPPEGPAIPQVAPWSVMPGWGVVADLTPPELIEMRRLRVLRKGIAGALVALVALCIAGYVFAMFQASSAQDGLDKTRNDGITLAAQGHKYAPVIGLQAATKSINDQIAQLMADDVDVANLLTRFRVAVPATMSLTSVNVSLSNASGATTATPGASPLDGTAVIVGSVTLSGTSTNLADLAGYIDTLQNMTGVIDVVPGSNSAGAKGVATWSLTLSLTDKVYSHKYDVKSGGK